MKLNEIKLLENREEYIISTLGNKIYTRYKEDMSAVGYLNDIVKDTNDKEECVKAIIAYFKKAICRTTIGLEKYIYWVCLQYANRLFFLEDWARVLTVLNTFNQNKNRFPQNERDINRYNFHQLEEKMDELTGRPTVKSARQQKQEIKLQGADKLGEDNKSVLIKLKTQEAAIYYGKNTKWCTAGTENNQFTFYNRKGPLFVLIDKTNNAKYQIHFEYGQVMDEMDQEVSSKKLMQEYPLYKALVEKKKKNIYNSIKNKNKLTVQTIGKITKFALNILEDRWPEAEQFIKTNCYQASTYAMTILRQRWPEAEPYILKGSFAIYQYAKYVIRGRWPEGEHALLTNMKDSVDADHAVDYAAEIIKDQWPELEKKLLEFNNPFHSVAPMVNYCIQVLKSKSATAEEYMIKQLNFALDIKKKNKKSDSMVFPLVLKSVLRYCSRFYYTIRVPKFEPYFIQDAGLLYQYLDEHCSMVEQIWREGEEALKKMDPKLYVDYMYGRNGKKPTDSSYALDA